MIKHKDLKLDLTTDVMCFGKKGSLYQILDLFRCDNNSCCEYDLEEGCTNNNCIKRIITKNHLTPYIVFREEDIMQNMRDFFFASGSVRVRADTYSTLV